MKLSRRNTLLLLSSLGASSLSGCSGLPYVGPKLSLTLLNFDSKRHFLNVEMVRAEGREQSESIVLREEFELPPPKEDEAAFARREPDILVSQKYVVRADLSDDRGIRDDYLFYPDCTGNGEPEEELYIEIRSSQGNSEPYIRFGQNECGDNSWWF